MAGIAKKFIKSFTHAFHGIVFLFNSQVNARIELIITGIVIIAGILFRISISEWLIILLCITLVLSLEGINTAIEIFADKLHPDFDKEIGKVKDVAAGAVLIASIVAAIIGFIIFVPRLLEFFLN
jgi:diacylglycerol kinase (ATP)